MMTLSTPSTNYGFQLTENNTGQYVTIKAIGVSGIFTPDSLSCLPSYVGFITTDAGNTGAVFASDLVQL